jgi:RNA polymerase sigma-70 factor (ECF subfamily)
VDVSEQDRPGSGRRLDDFDAIYEHELDYVWRTLGRFGVPPADLEDAAHEVFVILHRRITELDPARPVRPWLFGVARRVASDMRCKRRELPATVEPSVHHDPQLAERDLVWRALDALDDDRRTVVILHDLEGHTGAEIAELLAIPVNTVHSRLRLARHDLIASITKLRGQP